MIKMTLGLGALLTVATAIPAVAQEASELPSLAHRFKISSPVFPNEPASQSGILSRMQAAEEAPVTDSRIPQVIPGKKTAPVKYACKLNSTVQVSNQGTFVEKNIFEYSEDGLPVCRMVQKWDAQNAQWYDFKEYSYEYDGDGYPVKFYSLNKTRGGKGSSLTTYEYDANHYLTTQIVNFYSNGETTPYQKSEYAYDQWGQCIEEHVYEYDSATGVWNNVSWVRGELLPGGKQKWVEQYTWTGTKWKGVERRNYDYNEQGQYILFGESRWMADTDEWLYYNKFERSYREDGQISLDKQSFWNVDKNDWSGLYTYSDGKKYNTRTVYTYDEQDRIMSEENYRQQDNGEMLRGAVVQYEWSEPEAGVTRKQKFNYLCDAQGEILTRHSLNEILDTNPQGSALYKTQIETFDGWDTYKTITLEEYTYEDDGISIRDGATYEGDANGRPMPFAKEHYVYDADMNVIVSDYWQGQGTPDWHPYTHFTYEYENGVRTRKYCNRYNGTDFVPSWGEGWDWDFTVPFEQVMFWQADSDFPTKIDAMYSFVGNGSDWAADAIHYYYTSIESDGVASVSADNGSLRLKGRMLTAADAEAVINVYDMTGRRVATALGTVDVSGLQSGIYVAESRGENIKFTLR